MKASSSPSFQPCKTVLRDKAADGVSAIFILALDT
jgi:hypothetical protein